MRDVGPGRQGAARRSIVSGSIQFEGSYVEDGLTVSLSMSGPLTVRGKGTLL